MRRKNKLPELLSPAGDMQALFAAILGGADAIYVGGIRFGARAYAKNFTDEELRDAVKICHMFGVRLYVTLNTLVFDKEINDAIAYARNLHDMGVDALIVADIGVASRIKELIPDLELHASTQMGAHNTEGVNFAAELGCKRVVLARECSSENIKEIVRKSNAECEVFLHGALCVCHSGQCLFSSMVGGRSGNRGECAQPCRLPYNRGKYPLSLSDLSLSEHVKELVESGVASLKIEGRMKSASYVYEVTKIYRKLLDENRNSNIGEKKRLIDIFSRGGFTDGYFTGKIFSKMTGIRSEDDKKTTRDMSSDKFELPKIRVSAKAEFKKGQPCSLTLYTFSVPRWENAGLGDSERIFKEICVTSYGDIPIDAENHPLEDAEVKARLSKMGNTPFSLDISDIDITLDDGIFLNASSMNALRRNASQKLEAFFERKINAEEICENDINSVLATKNINNYLQNNELYKENVKSTTLFFNVKTLSSLNERNPDLLVSCGKIFIPLFEYRQIDEKLREKVEGVYIPPIIMENEWAEVLKCLENAQALGAKYALVGNISHFALIRGTNLMPVGDFRLNVTNRYAKDFYKKCGVCELILSPELTVPMARDIGGSIITLGRIPLMITERCFTKENFGCDKCGKAFLTDRKGAKFPLMREFSHRNVIFNSAPTYMGDKKEELKAAKLNQAHFIFSSESATECAELLASYKYAKPISVAHRRVGKR